MAIASASAPDAVALSISVATDDDFAWGAQLMATSEPWLTLRRGYDEILARLQRPHTVLMIARRHGGEPVGLLLLHPTGLAGSPYIAALAVAPTARGTGVGTALLRFAESYFPHARHLFLCVSSFNDRAAALYQRLGYRQVGELPDYAIEGASELIMHKRLPGPSA
jgi:ribosomal protein S18 acetylase RimI-like enzyme